MSSPKREIVNVALPGMLPPKKEFRPGIRRAPSRGFPFNREQSKIALKNALRYIPPRLHEEVAPEFLKELFTRGRIYGYRYRPEGPIQARPMEKYRGKILEAKAFQLMIDNNLDFDVALYPYELVTYGESGQVFQNWMQYRLVKMYLEKMEKNQTLVLYSGHPLGLFPTHRDAPKVIATHGLLVGMFDNAEGFQLAAADGGFQLRPDDRRRLDVHWPPGDRSRDVHHALERRQALSGSPAGRRSFRNRLSQLRTGRHERRPGQGRRDRRRHRGHRRSRRIAHRDPCEAGLDLDEFLPISIKSPVGSTSIEENERRSPSPITATSSICGNTS